LAQQLTRRQRETLPAAQRERQLLEIARDLLLADEPAGVTVEKVTAAAGVAKGTFYLYFDSKDHLLAKLWTDYLDTFIGTIQNLLADPKSSPPDWAAAVDVLIKHMIRYDIANAALHRAVFSRASGDALPLLHQADQKFITLLADRIDAAVAAGAASVSDPRTTAALLYYAVDGVLNTAHVTHTELGEETIVAAAREMVHRTLRTTRQGA
jgi:AcrR family transcriptional regulator